MRKLTKSEGRLLVILVVAVFLLANLYGLSILFDQETDVSRQLTDLQATQKTNQIWLREKDFWLARKQWMTAKQPKVEKGEMAQSQVLEALTSSARANQLTIEEQSFAEPKVTDAYRSVAVQLKVTGNLADVVKWLVQIQQPENFQAITRFSLKNGEKPPMVNLELQVSRWYAPSA
ncbi:MAG: hypothetical protein JO308_13950 [Verrucomicrobia bacterium]|nr:hypothetical protein [Verrucomicrobiota bacterium]